jgi:hypothetical protein
MAPSAKTTRYSKTDELDRYYGSVFSKLSETTRNALFIQLKRPEFIGNGASKTYRVWYRRELIAFLKEQEAITETGRDEITTLVKKLRKEPRS